MTQAQQLTAFYAQPLPSKHVPRRHFRKGTLGQRITVYYNLGLMFKQAARRASSARNASVFEGAAEHYDNYSARLLAALVAA